RQRRLLVWRETEAVGAGIRQVLLKPLHGDRLAGKTGRLRKCNIEDVGVELRDIRIAEQKNIVVLNVEAAEREIGRACRDREWHGSVAAFAAGNDHLVVLLPWKVMARDVGPAGPGHQPRGPAGPPTLWFAVL